MTEYTTFLVGSLALLAMPGPTNTVLAVAGAVSGVARSLTLLPAVLAGYLAAIAILRLAVGPVIAALPLFGIALRIAVCLYLVHMAVALWRRGAVPAAAGEAVSTAGIFLTTLLNPKAVILAFTLIPFAPATGVSAMLPMFVQLALLIILTGGAWVLIGATLQRGAGSLAACRIAAVALLLTVGMIGWTTLSLARNLGTAPAAQPG